MTRDQALIIAKRLMRRIEDDQAIHLDSLADELVMGMALSKPAITQSVVEANKAKAFLQAKEDEFNRWNATIKNALQRGYFMGAK